MSSEASQALARILSMPMDAVPTVAPPPPRPPRPPRKPQPYRLKHPRDQQRQVVLAALRAATEPVTANQLAEQLGMRRRYITTAMWHLGQSGDAVRTGHTLTRGSVTYLWRAA